MNRILQRIAMAYRPLYLRGLLLDGQYRLPAADQPAAVENPAPQAHPRDLPSSLDDIEPQERIDAPLRHSDDRNDDWTSASAETRHL